MKFNIGDKVRVIKAYGSASVGDEGIIKALPWENGSISYQSCYAVEFPSWSHGHDCNGKVPSGKGLWVLPECLELVEKRRLRVGDRIKMIKNRDGAGKGMTGRIVNICSSSALPYGVEFDKEFNGGHGCSGACKRGYGQWVAGDDFEVITDSKPATEKIVITHDGKTTTAKLYDGKEITKTAEAKCSPDDKFDFAAGAKLAFERLMDEEKKEPPKFDKSMLTTGRIGYMSGGQGWFVVVGGRIVYKDGGYDEIKIMDENGKFSHYHVECIVDARSFADARDLLIKTVA